MRMMKLALVALAALFAWSATAEALEVKKRREAPGEATQVWTLVGDFCAIKDWHPAVTDCVEETEGDVVYRTLTLKDGGKIKEKLTDKGATSYSYEIVESPLPVKNYKATLRVGPDDEENRVEIVWTAAFDANGASDEDATKTITGILNDGVGGIKSKANDAHYGDSEHKASAPGDDEDKDDDDND
jgi:hypothetical protein